MAKFQGDRLRGLGESVAKITSRAEYKPVRNGVPGGLKISNHFGKMSEKFRGMGIFWLTLYDAVLTRKHSDSANLHQVAIFNFV